MAPCKRVMMILVVTAGLPGYATVEYIGTFVAIVTVIVLMAQGWAAIRRLQSQKVVTGKISAEITGQIKAEDNID